MANRRERLDAAATRIEQAAGAMSELRDEYQEWYDNLPEAFLDSPTSEKLEEVIDRLCEWIDQLEEVTAEARDLDLPIGYGRD